MLLGEVLQIIRTYPNVAPDPSMYCPRVLVTPLGPAPYLMMLKPPILFQHCGYRCGILQASRTKYEAHDQANGYTKLLISTIIKYEIKRPTASKHSTHLPCSISVNGPGFQGLPHKHLSKVDGPRIPPPPCELDGIGGMVSCEMP